MADSEEPRKPDYYVAAMNAALRNPRVGGAWVNKDESISIKLDPFIVLDNSQGDLQIRLFPRRERDGG